MKTLIVYASKYGFTEKCANLISKELNNQADLINLKKVKSINLSEYDKVIIGGSIYIGKIQKEVTKFCTKNLDKLKEKRIGLFICAMQSGEAINTELDANFPEELLKIAVIKGPLGGELLLDKMNFFDKMVIKKVTKVTENRSILLEDKIHEFAEAMK
jgi:menaquinone-dependent protoporphyrinogen oxidase